MKKRIITTENLEEDLKIENHLRPQLLEDYIGQEKAKETLKSVIENYPDDEANYQEIVGLAQEKLNLIETTSNE